MRGEIGHKLRSNKVAPPLLDLKRVARLVTTDKHELIRSLKRSKKKKTIIKKIKSSSCKSDGVSLSVGYSSTRNPDDRRIGWCFMVILKRL